MQGVSKERKGVWVSLEASAFLENSFSSIPISSFADYSSKPVSTFKQHFHGPLCVSGAPIMSALIALLPRTTLQVFEETGDFHPEPPLSRRAGESSPAAFTLVP